MLIRFLFISTITMPQLGWSADSIQTMTSSQFVAFATCSPRAEVMEQITFKDARDLQHFNQHRHNLQNYIANANEEIQQALNKDDTFQAAMICAWVDDLTRGFKACPSDTDPEQDLVSETTLTECQHLSQ